VIPDRIPPVYQIALVINWEELILPARKATKLDGQVSELFGKARQGPSSYHGNHFLTSIFFLILNFSLSNEKL